MIKKLTLCMAVLFVSACSTIGLGEPNCFQSVAVSKIAIAEAYESAATLSEGELISVGAAREVKTILDSANATATNASQLCIIDEKAASDYLDAVSKSLNDVSNILTEK